VQLVQQVHLIIRILQEFIQHPSTHLFLPHHHPSTQNTTHRQTLPHSSSKKYTFSSQLGDEFWDYLVGIPPVHKLMIQNLPEKVKVFHEQSPIDGSTPDEVLELSILLNSEKIHI